MILQYLTAEFENEVNSTRKLLQAIQENDLGYKPSEIFWTMGGTGPTHYDHLLLVCGRTDRRCI